MKTYHILKCPICFGEMKSDKSHIFARQLSVNSYYCVANYDFHSFDLWYDPKTQKVATFSCRTFSCRTQEFRICPTYDEQINISYNQQIYTIPNQSWKPQSLQLAPQEAYDRCQRLIKLLAFL